MSAAICAITLLSLDCVVYVLYLTVSQYCLVIVMATGNSQPGADRKGIYFKVHIQIPWNAPEAYVMLDSPGVFELYADFLLDVLGLRTWHSDAAPVRFCWVEMRGVRVLIPDKKELYRGFHDVTLLDMADELQHVMPIGDLGRLRCSPVCQRNR